jgi:outer membrane protein assembly factor BamB
VRVYKNGELVSEIEETREIFLPNQNIYLGGMKHSSPFHGVVDEFAVFSRKLTGQEINSMMNAEISSDESGLELLYHFDNDAQVGESNELIYDWAGKGRNAIYDRHLTSRVKWPLSEEDMFRGRIRPGLGQLASDGNKVYLSNIFFNAFDANTGELLWSKGNQDQNMETGDIVYFSDVVYSEGYVYVMGQECLVGSDNPKYCSQFAAPCLYKFSEAGDLIRNYCVFDVPARIDQSRIIPGRNNFNFIVEGNRAYFFRYDSGLLKLISLNLDTGDVEWEYSRPSGEQVGDFLLSGDSLFISSYIADAPPVISVNKFNGEVENIFKDYINVFSRKENHVYFFGESYAGNLYTSSLIAADNKIFMVNFYKQDKN